MNDKKRSSKLSSSADRFSFQRENYIKRAKEQGDAVNESYLDFFNQMREDHDHRFDDEETQKNNMEYDLRSSEWMVGKVQASESYAQNLYAAMCNNEFQRLDVFPILKGETWGCSWRYAGGIIADMRGEGDYIDWYCSGIRNVSHDEEENKLWDGRNYVAESVVTEEIHQDLRQLGWMVVRDSDHD